MTQQTGGQALPAQAFLVPRGGLRDPKTLKNLVPRTINLERLT